MRTLVILSLLLLCSCSKSAPGTGGGMSSSDGPEWAMKATIIEACSCPMFCQCYFNSSPAGHAHSHGHGEEHFCRFNNAYKVDEGQYKGVSLKDAKFWIAGDLGGDFSKGEAEWAVLTFDPAVTPEQREGIKQILPHVYPVTWGSYSIAADAPMSWEASKDHATAKLGGGKIAEVVLHRNPGNTEEPTVIHNLKYWGAPRNEGFVLMPNEVEAYRAGSKPFEYRGTNGFMITFDINSNDVEQSSQAAAESPDSLRASR